MNPWLVILLAAMVIVACVMIFYMILTKIIFFIAKRHADKTLKKYTERVNAILPGLNCGKCGCATCRAYAEALVYCREEDQARCTEGGEALIEKVQECLGELDQLMAPAEHTSPDAREDMTV